MATILDGKKLREKLLEKLKSELDGFETKPSLVVILVGDNPASQIYVNNKKKTAEKLGINSVVINYPSNITEDELLQKIDELNNDKTVTAILVQLPLPGHISKENINLIKNSLEKPGVVLICGASLSGKTHLIYSILSNLIPKNKNVMTLESIAKYKLKNVSQCELNENIGFNLDKAMRFIEFQSPDILYFEGITTKEGLDFFTSLTLKNKSLITEFLAENMEDLRKKFEFSEFTMFKSVISCLIFIHGKDSIEVFDKETLTKSEAGQ